MDRINEEFDWLKEAELKQEEIALQKQAEEKAVQKLVAKVYNAVLKKDGWKGRKKKGNDSDNGFIFICSRNRKPSSKAGGRDRSDPRTLMLLQVQKILLLNGRRIFYCEFYSLICSRATLRTEWICSSSKE